MTSAEAPAPISPSTPADPAPAQAATPPVAEPAPTTPTDPAPADPTAAEPTTPAAEPQAVEPQADPEPQPQAPESYEFSVPEGMPEGFELDGAVRDTFAKTARELDLSQDSAQKILVDILPVMHQREQEAQAAVHQQWIEEAQKDPELGGSKAKESERLIALARDEFASDELKQLLDGPLGLHPEIKRLFLNVGKAVSEDKYVGGERREAAPDRNDPAAMAQRWYGDSNKT